jgi:DNA-binding transcriptional LysR family regulator
VRLGITEGRLRIFLPDLLKRYQEQYPHIILKATSAPTTQMLDLLLENKLDLVLGNYTSRGRPNLEYTPIFEENLFLVVSDNLLRQYFPAKFPACKRTFAKGVDLHQFAELPFCLLYQDFNSRTILEEFLQKSNLSLRVIYEASQPDLLHIMTAHDYACSFCLTMYLSNIKDLNRRTENGNRLNIFPVKGLTAKNPLYLISRKEKYFPQYTKALARLIREQCQSYQSVEC